MMNRDPSSRIPRRALSRAWPWCLVILLIAALAVPLGAGRSTAVRAAAQAQDAAPLVPDTATDIATATATPSTTPTATSTVVAQPTLVASSSTAQAGTAVTFSGSGYPVGDTIAVTLNGAALCSLSTDGSGNLNTGTSCMVPVNLSKGSYTVAASDNTHGQLATTTLAISPALTVTTTAATPGGQLTFYGYGFPANDTLNIYLGGYQLCTVFSNSIGQLASTSCTVNSSTQSGSYQLTANDVGGQQAATSSTVTVTGSSAGFTLSPTSGAAGSAVAVYATGFSAYETVNLYVGGTYVTAAAADAYGNLSLSFTYPASAAAGNGTVELLGQQSGHVETATFDVTGASGNLSLALSPASGVAGTTVTASGYANTAFGTGQPIVIDFGATQVASTTTNSLGYYSVSFSVPSGQSGAVTVTADETTYGYLATEPFTITAPQITLGSASAVPGTALAISGSGFVPGEAVTITLPGGGTTSVTADGSGNFSTSATLATGLAAGTATVSALGASGQSAATATLTITGATLTASPSSVQAGSQVTISGAGFAPGEAVALAGSDGSAQTVTADSLGNLSATLTVGASQAAGTMTVTATGATSRQTASTGITVTAVPPTVPPASTATPQPTATSTTITAPAVTTGSATWYFASGRTDSGYGEQIDVLNPNTSPVQGTITFYYGNGQSTSSTFSLAAQARGSYDVGTTVGARNGIAAVVHASLPVAATATSIHGTTNKTALAGVASPSAQWYFAEGYTGQTFQESLDLFNPGATAATVQVVWPRSGGAPVRLTVTLPAHTHRTIAVNHYVTRASHGTIISANHPVVASRTMIFGTHGQGTTTAPGTTGAATTLYLAEGSTANGLQEFVSLLNPHSTGSAHVTVTFYGSAGTVLGTRSLTIGALQRGSIAVNGVTHASSVAALVTSDLPVVAERAMYTGGPNGGTAGGSDVVATAKPASGWAFASGDTSPGQKEFDVLFNPGLTATTVLATWYTSGGQLVQQRVSLPAHARVTIDVNASVSSLPAGSHGLVLQSVDGTTFVAEQALYDSALQQAAAVLGTPLS